MATSPWRAATTLKGVKDQPLSFHWSGVTDEQIHQIGLVTAGTQNRRSARRIIVTNLYLAKCANRWVSYSRDRNHYTACRWYYGPAYSYRHVLAVVEELLGADLIQEERANPGQLSWQSRIRPTARFGHLLGLVERIDYIPQQLLRLKDATGRLAKYRETAEIRVMSRGVARLNEACAAASITLASPDLEWGAATLHIDGQVVHPAKVRGYRVFNGSWGGGGRFYGPFWQNLSKQRRATMLLQGCTVAEPDFAQLHPRLLYAQFGASPDGDAYTVKGFEDQRPTMKTAWQMMINAGSRPSAVVALARELGGLKFQSEARRILSALENRHARIASAFHSGVGIRLQRVDFDLMMRVEDTLISEGIVALPVHDSFVVQAGKPSLRAEQVMDDELQKVLTNKQ